MKEQATHVSHAGEEAREASVWFYQETILSTESFRAFLGMLEHSVPSGHSVF